MNTRIYNKKTSLLVAMVTMLVACVAWAQPASAESIQQMDVDITVFEDSSIRVEERILYDFNTGQRHGIFRTLPEQYFLDDGSQVRLPITFHSVTDENGEEYMYEVNRSGNYVTAKIGDPDRTITGQNWYEITYSLPNVLSPQDGKAELYWDVTGNDWQVPIYNVTVTIHLPEGDDAPLFSCYTGSFGVSSSDCTISKVDNSTIVSNIADYLSFGEGFTVATSFSADRVELPGKLEIEATPSYADIYVDGVEWATESPLSTRLSVGTHTIEVKEFLWETASETVTIESGETVTLEFDLAKQWWAPIVSVAAPVTLFVAISVLLFFIWGKYGRDLAPRRSIIAQYEPIDDLTAGEIGTIVDQVSGKRELSATVIHLAVKGYMHIKKLDKKKAIAGRKQHDYVFTLKKEFARTESEQAAEQRRMREAGEQPLEDFEYKMLYGVFGNEKTEIKLSDLAKKFYKHVPKIRDGMYDAVVAKEYFRNDPRKVRNTFVALGFVLIIGGGFAGIWFIEYVRSPFLLLALVIIGIELLVLSFVMPQRTSKGVRATEHIKGFKRYLSVAEKDRLAFHAAPEKFKDSDELFQEYLPYAIALGVEKKWAEQFEELHQPDWYNDPTMQVFRTNLFVSSLTSMTGTVGSVVGNSASSSGGSGGGGFSGGGFGGGGGGSW